MPSDSAPAVPNGDEPSRGSKSQPPASPQEGIPDSPAGNPTFEGKAADDGTTRPVESLPAVDFWDVLYGRRSIRKFTDQAVERPLIDQVMHAGIWAPSSCNYQMWDLIAVTDPDVNLRLAKLSTQMANAPVNIVVSYGREFSEEAWANIQSASALIQNMSLAAHALGLGTFWITQTGGADKVREAVGLPLDRIVVAVLALGYPKVTPKRGPKRRPLDQVTHYNHYAGRPIPSSANPNDWAPDLLATYQRARVLNGLRHNKPRAWEQTALIEALDCLVPEGTERPDGAERARWLDVLPCTGILTAKIAPLRKGFTFDVVERSSEVAEFCAGRVSPRGGAFGWPSSTSDLPSPKPGSYDVVSCFFRVEGLRAEDRADLLREMASWLKPGGKLILGYVSSRSFHGWTERARARRGGPKGVEYVLSPDPNIGPFEAVSPKEIDAIVAGAGLSIETRMGTQPAPPVDEITFRTRNMGQGTGKIIRSAAAAARLLEKLPGASARRGRFQFLAAHAPSK